MNTRRLKLGGLVLSCGVVGLLMLGVALASGSAPKEPETKPANEVTNTTALLTGVLNPHGKDTDGWFFAYSTGSGCTGAGTTAVEAEGEVEAESVQSTVTGLTSNTTYTFCLVARNSAGEVEVGNAMSFTTSVAPQKPETKPASQITNTTANLEGVVNPTIKAVDSWYFQYNTGGTCTGGSTTPVEAPAEVEGQAASAGVSGLKPGSLYTFCLVTRNGTGEVAVGSSVSFTTTTEAPTVGEGSSSSVDVNSATVNAQINAEGSPTTYRVEYGTAESKQYGSSTPTADLGVLDSVVGVSVELTGLEMDTAYHYRFVATNGYGIKQGQELTLTTGQPALSSGLPDGRVYEMVTPPNNHNADAYAPEIPATNNSNHGVSSLFPFQSSQSGDAVTYAGDPGPGGSGASGGGPLANQYLAVRTSSGWSQRDISLLGHDHADYEAFSPELSTGILAAGGRYDELSALLPEAPARARVLYKSNISDGNEHALFTSLPVGVEPSEFEYGVQFAGASEDYSTLLFEAPGGLTPGGPSGHGLYASTDGQLRLINILPGGGTESQATFGGSSVGTGEGKPSYSHDISVDGSRIFWTGLNSHRLYMSETGAEPIQIDASKAGGSGGGGVFLTASNDGSRVFFTDDASAMLTADTVPGSGANLYEYNVNGGAVADLTPGPDARVQGVIGASEDGSYVYFVADGVFAHGAASGGCDGSYSGASEIAKCNLYVRHEGVTTYIGSLTEKNGIGASPYGHGGGGGENGDWVRGLRGRTAEVTPSGKEIVFTSDQALTGYQNEGLYEVYVYDADLGELSCASCDPGGQALPPGAGPGVAAALPISSNPTRPTRWIADDGDQVFFESDVPLVSQDTNGFIDVYEWERGETGGCHVHTGCVSLLSGGKSDDNSYLYDVSPSGRDVFFTTRAALVESDKAGLFAVYDARVDGSSPPAGLACSGTGCQGLPGAPPIFATPSSVTFNGVGNFLPPSVVGAVAPKAKPLTRAQKLSKALKACRRKQAKKRTTCEAQARKRYTAAKSKSTRSAKGRK